MGQCSEEIRASSGTVQALNLAEGHTPGFLDQAVDLFIHDCGGRVTVNGSKRYQNEAVYMRKTLTEGGR